MHVSFDEIQKQERPSPVYEKKGKRERCLWKFFLWGEQQVLSSLCVLKERPNWLKERNEYLCTAPCSWLKLQLYCFMRNPYSLQAYIPIRSNSQYIRCVHVSVPPFFPPVRNKQTRTLLKKEQWKVCTHSVVMAHRQMFIALGNFPSYFVIWWILY